MHAYILNMGMKWYVCLQIVRTAFMTDRSRTNPYDCLCIYQVVYVLIKFICQLFFVLGDSL